DQKCAVVTPSAAIAVAARTVCSVRNPGPYRVKPASDMPCLVHSLRKPSASSVSKAAKTFLVGWALIWPIALDQSPPLGKAARAVAVAPSPATNASANSAPDASSTAHTKNSLRPLRAAHWPSGALSCQELADVRNTYLVAFERVSSFAVALVSMYTTFAASAASRSTNAVSSLAAPSRMSDFSVVSKVLIFTLLIPASMDSAA